MSQAISFSTPRPSSRTAEAVRHDPDKWLGVPKWAVGVGLIVLAAALGVWQLWPTSGGGLPPALFVALSMNDLAGATAAVEKDPAQVRSFDPDGNTPLHVAASSGSVAAVKLLLAHGADANALNAQFQTPLVVAAFYASHDRPDVVRALLAGGARPNRTLADGQNLWHQAAKWKAVNPAVLTLLAGDRAALQAVDAKGRTPHALAVQLGHTSVAATLEQIEAAH